MPIELRINGASRKVETDPERTLLEVLRDELNLTGAKYGCGEGQCGACTVLVAGKASRACITPVGTVAGKPIVTIEGLEKQGHLHPVQEAFIDEDAMQCGYCTPGMILSAVALLNRNPNPTDAQIAQGMQGNLCRCCAYARIVAAVRSASKKNGRASR
jgi:aerobic-type carbon monoxide dehydrogenase small subunit (CoxS/CutS family)